MTDDKLIRDLEESPPSRELSDRVLLACGWKRVHPWHDKMGFEQPEKLSASLPWRWRSSSGEEFQPGRQPDPTRNLQDAVDWVVPEGWSYEVRCSAYGEMAKAEVWDGRTCGVGGSVPFAGSVDRVDGCAALCIASLEARAALRARKERKDEPKNPWRKLR